MTVIDKSRVAELDRELAALTAEQRLSRLNAEFGTAVSLANSFSGATDMVLVDMLAKLDLPFEVFYLDTELLFPETYQLIEETRRRYGIEPVAYRPKQTVAEQAAEHGDALWAREPDRCCALRKMEPIARALEGKQAWITGMRRDQSPARAGTPIFQWDDTFGLAKLNALVDWTEDETWEYVRERDVPVNALHEQGYPSIGCMPCTRPVMPGEDPRAGRWAGTVKTECGLHLPKQHAGVA
jgi:phosphoadenosine phosphosulfate reductase